MSFSYKSAFKCPNCNSGLYKNGMSLDLLCCKKCNLFFDETELIKDD